MKQKTQWHRVARANRQKGAVSLAEVLVVVAVMAILGAVIGMNTSTDSSRAQALWSSMQTVGDGLKRMKMQVGCYPIVPGALLDKSQATAANMYCGQDATSMWDGPYVSSTPYDGTNNAFLMKSVGPSAEFSFSREAGGNNGFLYFLHATNLSSGVVLDALQKCNNSKTTGTTFGMTTGQCRGMTSSSSSAGGTFDVLVEDSAS